MHCQWPVANSLGVISHKKDFKYSWLFQLLGIRIRSLDLTEQFEIKIFVNSKDLTPFLIKEKGG